MDFFFLNARSQDLWRRERVGVHLLQTHRSVCGWKGGRRELSRVKRVKERRTKRTARLSTALQRISSREGRHLNVTVWKVSQTEPFATQTAGRRYICNPSFQLQVCFV